MHPREIRQVLNPFKQLAFQRGIAQSNTLQRFPRCKGFFWDSKNMRLVEVDLGHVYLRPVFSYRAASSLAVSFFGESAELLSREEGAAPYENFSTFEHRAERSEHGAEEGEKSPGPYVIPGQSPTDGNNAQKIGNNISFKDGNGLAYVEANAFSISNVKNRHGNTVRESSRSGHPAAIFESDFDWSVEKCEAELC